MYPVTLDYQNKIKESVRDFRAEIKIKHATGEITLTDKDIVLGSLSYTESSQPGEDFIVGGATVSSVSFSIFNKDSYDEIVFDGAKVYVSIALLIREGVDAHFLQPSQPSKMSAGDALWELVPLGVFTIDDAKKQVNTIAIKAMDNMAKTELPYNLSKLSYPATLYQIYVDACNVCDITVGTVSFPNMGYKIEERPKGDMSFRDILRSVGELSGTFVKVNRLGAMELRWYKPTGIIIRPDERADLKLGDGVLQITGVMATVGDKLYIVGTEDYAIDLSGNPLVQGDPSTAIRGVFNNIKDTKFVPFQSSWKGNPAIQAGDIITQVDRLGVSYQTLVTSTHFKYRGKSNLYAKGLPILKKRYQGSMGKIIARVSQNVEEQLGNLETSLEQAQSTATELLANMLGGYYIKDPETGVVYIANHPELDKATEYWKMGLGGFGHYKNGVLDTSVTADGSIVAMLVAANIVTANMVQTGTLTSKDNSSWFNLDNGEINIKNQLKFVDGKLTLAGIDPGNKVFNSTPTTPYSVNDIWKVSGIPGVDFKICTRARSSGSYVSGDWVNITNSKDYADLIKNLTSGTAIQGGTTTIDNTKVRVSHGSTIEYSELNATGFKRQWPYGESEYLTDIWLGNFAYAGGITFDRPEPVRVVLPSRFKGRGREVEIFLTVSDLRIRIGSASDMDRLNWITSDSNTRLRAVDTNFDITSPEIWVDSFVHNKWMGRENNWRSEDSYNRLGFTIIVVGR